jgi:mono/diheme cytochrome c family protein
LVELLDAGGRVMTRRRPEPSSGGLAAFLLLAAVLGALGAGVARAQPAGETPRTAAGWRAGAEVYAKVCRYCHESGVAPVLLGRKLPAPVIAVFVRNGSRAMPAFRSAEIDDAALAQLGEYISKN